VSWFFRPHSKPGTVSECAVSETEPGVNAAVMQIDEEPMSGWSAMSLACVVMSIGDRWANSSA
jgi:hypothetical protein